MSSSVKFDHGFGTVPTRVREEKRTNPGPKSLTQLTTGFEQEKGRGGRAMGNSCRAIFMFYFRMLHIICPDICRGDLKSLQSMGGVKGTPPILCERGFLTVQMAG
jgi:hypothetical protein